MKVNIKCNKNYSNMEAGKFLGNFDLKNLMSFLDTKVIVIREYVRYYEVDKMQVVHHSNYFRYYELIRMIILFL